LIPLKLIDLTPETLDKIPREQIAPLILQLASFQSLLAGKLLESGERIEPGKSDRLMEIGEAAAKLSVTEDWLYRKGDRLPFVVRMGRNIRFSEQGIEKYIRQRIGH